MNSSLFFDDLGFYYIEPLQDTQIIQPVKSSFERWLPMLLLFVVIAAWEVKRMILVFRNRCPVRDLPELSCTHVADHATNLTIEKCQNCRCGFDNWEMVNKHPLLLGISICS